MTNLNSEIYPYPSNYFTAKELGELFHISYGALRNLCRINRVYPVTLENLKFDINYHKTLFAEAKGLIGVYPKSGKKFFKETSLFSNVQKNRLKDALLNTSAPVRVIDPDPSDYLNLINLRKIFNNKDPLYPSLAKHLEDEGIPYIRLKDIRFSTIERRVEFLKYLTKGWSTGKCSNIFVHKRDISLRTGYAPEEVELISSKPEQVHNTPTPPVLEQLEQIFGKEWQHLDLIKKEFKIKEISEMNLTREQLIEKLATYQL